MRKLLVLVFLVACGGAAHAEVSPYKFTAWTVFDGHRRDVPFPSKFTMDKWYCWADAPRNGPLGWEGVIHCFAEPTSEAGFAVFARCSEKHPTDQSSIIITSASLATENILSGVLFYRCEQSP
jgi:hypothetical protein